MYEGMDEKDRELLIMAEDIWSEGGPTYDPASEGPIMDKGRYF